MAITIVEGEAQSGGYADFVAKMNERKAKQAADILSKQNPTSSSKNMTVSADGMDFSTTYSKNSSSVNNQDYSDRFKLSARTSDKAQLIFPSDLCTAENNQYWTKITIYEVQYELESEDKESGKSQRTNTAWYAKNGSTATTRFKSGETMAKMKGAVDVSKNSSESTTDSGSLFHNYVMVDKTIALPYPTTSPEWNFMTGWGDEVDWGTTGGVIEALQKSVQEGDHFGALGDVADLVSKTVKGVMTKFPVAGKAIKGAQREAMNDRKEFMWSGSMMNRRTPLSWQFYPKNQKEAATIYEIVDVIKSFSLPTLKQTTGKSGVNVNWMVFPALFEICFMNGSDENTSMPRFGPCGIVDLKIDAMPDKWLAHSDGSPMTLKLDISFTEVFPLTRENLINDGTHMYVR